MRDSLLDDNDLILIICTDNKHLVLFIYGGLINIEVDSWYVHYRYRPTIIIIYNYN